MSDPDALACAVEIAGRLAELGETRLTLLQPGLPPRPLPVRQTDLPSLIVSVMTAGGGTLLAETLGIRIVIDATGPCWPE